MRKVLCNLFLIIAPTCLAHVGSPDVFFEGDAGPYRLFIVVRMPPTVPGVAEIEIRSDSGDVREIRIVPMRLIGAGSQIGPTPDNTEQSKTDPRSFTARLWLMEFHALQVRIEVDGARGKGELALPVMAEAQRTLPMQKPLGTILLALMLFLAAGCVSIVHAAASEARLEPGTVLDARELPGLRRVTFVTILVVTGIILSGDLWWSAQARAYANVVFKPPRITASRQPTGRLALSAPEGKWSRYRWSELTKPSALIPDHHHLMHLFLVRMPGIDQFWHLHPEPDVDGFFSQDMPSLPAGRYQLFADIVTNAGWALTLTGEVSLPEVRGRPMIGDDAGVAAAALSSSATTTVSMLSQGARMIWETDNAPPKANMATRLRFRVEDQDGKPVQDLEPYMGMTGHLVVICSDGSVFAHVHPSGSPAMATVDLAQATLQADTGGSAGNPHASHTSGRVASEVSFPYGFPKAGDYRLFVQVRRSRHIETGIFDVQVIQ